MIVDQVSPEIFKADSGRHKLIFEKFLNVCLLLETSLRAENFILELQQMKLQQEFLRFQ